MIIPSRRRVLPVALGAAALAVNAFVALYYARLGLTLSHYDARGHLVVARRVLDSLTPGWQQIGAVWLPLPHLLNLLPVQIDWFYQTGASAVAIAVLAGALASGAIAWIVLQLTDSAAASTAAAVAFALNPNVLYLQATPMTEPLLLGLTLISVASLIWWCSSSDDNRSATVGLAFALACWTRYEAWPVTVAALTAAVWARWRLGDSLRRAVLRVARIGVYPVVAAVAFVVLSRVVVGDWFTASGFFVPENKALDRPLLALSEIAWGTHALTGTLTMAIAAVGLVWVLANGLSDRQRAASLVALSLLASAALAWAAFVKGHPFRIRYMVPLIAAEAVGIGAAAAIVRRGRLVAILLIGLALITEVRPLSSLAPMVIEAQWDRPNVRARQRVTECLRERDDGETIMASMGSLGHYMQEMSRDGFSIRRFLHEGNGDIWLWALDGPHRYAGWLLIEEKAEGGDMLAHRARELPSFLDGYRRVCDAAGVALYRREPRIWSSRESGH